MGFHLNGYGVLFTDSVRKGKKNIYLQSKIIFFFICSRILLEVRGKTCINKCYILNQ